MHHRGSRVAHAIAGLGLALVIVACGKKAPLRLPDSRAPEQAPAVHARVREGQVTLDFRVPRRRLFPEREEPWVLARILRKPESSPEYVEAGAVLEPGGFPFDTPMTWVDQALPPQSSMVYRVEFRDAVRRRRALSDPLTVTWDHVPGAPSMLMVVGGVRVIGLIWDAPAGSAAGISYRVYRRERSRQPAEPVSPELVMENRFVDARVEPGRDYCYTVRSVIIAQALEVEGPASAEECSRPSDEETPPAQPPADDPGGFPVTP